MRRGRIYAVSSIATPRAKRTQPTQPAVISQGKACGGMVFIVPTGSVVARLTISIMERFNCKKIKKREK
jgi:hypothetical protein